MHRHKQTLDGIAKAYEERGLQLPQHDVDDGLNEFDHGSVFSAYMQQHADHPIVKAAATGETRATGAMVHAALLAWVDDRLGDLQETWQDFGMRARLAAERLHDVESDETLVVSSGGLISRIAQAALDIPDQRAVDLNISLRNSALSEFSCAGPAMATGHVECLAAFAQRKRHVDLFLAYGGCAQERDRISPSSRSRS